jgi:hypothetical protein
VNDVYAFLLTGKKDHAISPEPTQFPTRQEELDPIIAFAAEKGVTFADPEALAIMVKSSWVLADELPNLDTYITTMAKVQRYDTHDPNNWVPTVQQTVRLALVGMHVVGSANGHHEMIWATFEHMANAPRADYQYVNTHGILTTVHPDLGRGDWVFTHEDTSGPFNQPHMHVDSNVAREMIHSNDGFGITPSDTIRWKAFGAASEGSPNPLANAAASNTDIISINNSVIGRLVSPDVRRNYVMTGATWTIGGGAPTEKFQIHNSRATGVIVGTSVLANSTMETYGQGRDNTLAHGGSSCFTCHLTDTVEVSRDFGNLQPLTRFTQNPGYTITTFPPNLFVNLSSAQFALTATNQIFVVPLNGFLPSVRLSVEGLPKGVKAFFDRSLTTTSSTLTLTVPPETPAGVSTVKILGRSEELTSSTSLSLTIIKRSFSLGASPDTLTIDRGSGGMSTITIYSIDGFSDDVTLEASNLPDGVTATFSPNPATSTSVLTLTASPNAPLGPAIVTIKGTSGKLNATTTLALMVEESCNDNLVLNGSFEAGGFTGWSLGGDFKRTDVVSGPFYVYPAGEDGQFYVALGTGGSDGTLSQTLGTTPGENYRVRFWMASVGDDASNFSAFWNGAPVYVAANPATAGAWTQFSFTLTGGGNDTIGFGFRDSAGYIALDNVSVCRTNTGGKTKK